MSNGGQSSHEKKKRLLKGKYLHFAKVGDKNVFS